MSLTIHDRKKSLQDGPEWLRDGLTDDAGNAERVGAGAYFLVKRSWQITPERAAPTPTYNLKLLYMRAYYICTHFEMHDLFGKLCGGSSRM